MPETLPEHGLCFVCGSQNERGLGVTWQLEADGAVVTEISLTMAQQGPPGHAHGGATTALLDEAMGAAVWQAGSKALAVNLNVTFHRPVPLGAPVSVVGRVGEKIGRKIHASGLIRLPDGEIAVSATGLFVEAGHLLPDSLKDRRWP